MEDESNALQRSLLARPTTQLLDEFGAGNASPGSGSAAALMGLLAAKLLITVCDKSLTKPECSDHAVGLAHIKEQVQAIEPRLKELFEKDAREFDEVVALRIARDQAESPTDGARFARQSQDLLETATDNAFAVIEQCMKLIDHGVIAFDSGWKPVRGDSGAAISAAIAGVLSGIFIANLNLKTLKKRKYAKDNLARCAELYEQVSAKQLRAFARVTSLNAEANAQQIAVRTGNYDLDVYANLGMAATGAGGLDSTLLEQGILGLLDVCTKRIEQTRSQ